MQRALALALLAVIPMVATALNATADGRQLSGTDRFLLCGVDLIGDDTESKRSSDALKCPILCDDFGTAATWTNLNGGTCWRKNVHYFPPRSSTGKPNAVSMFWGAASLSSALTAKTLDGVDLPGFDIGSTKKADARLCETDCIARADCFAFTWTNYNGGTCWLKNRASTPVATAGAKSTLMARIPVASEQCATVF